MNSWLCNCNAVHSEHDEELIGRFIPSLSDMHEKKWRKRVTHVWNPSLVLSMGGGPKQRQKQNKQREWWKSSFYFSTSVLFFFHIQSPPHIDNEYSSNKVFPRECIPTNLIFFMKQPFSTERECSLKIKGCVNWNLITSSHPYTLGVCLFVSNWSF